MVNVNFKMIPPPNNPPDVLQRLSLKDQFKVLFRVVEHMQDNIAAGRENSLPAADSSAQVQRGSRGPSTAKIENITELATGLVANLEGNRIVDLVLTQTGELAMDYARFEDFRIMTGKPWWTDQRGEDIFRGGTKQGPGNSTTQIPRAHIDHVILALTDYLTFKQRRDVNKLSRTLQRQANR